MNSASHSSIYLEPETSSGWQTLWINVVCKLCAIFVMLNSFQHLSLFSCWIHFSISPFCHAEFISASHSCIYLEPETSSGWQTLWINVVCKLCAPPCHAELVSASHSSISSPFVMLNSFQHLVSAFLNQLITN